jgi:hypothetical protein
MLLMICSPRVVIDADVAGVVLRGCAGCFRLNQSAMTGKRIARGSATVHSVEWKLRAAPPKRVGTQRAATGFRDHKELFSETVTKTFP